MEQEIGRVKKEKESQATSSSMIVLVYRKFALLLYYQGVHVQAGPPKAKEREVKANITQWNQEQLQLLIKGVNLYPPGTADRLVICKSSHSIQAEPHPQPGGTLSPTTSTHISIVIRRLDQW